MIFKRILTIAAAAFTLTAHAQVEKWQTGIVKQEFLYDKAPFPSCHSATIAETPTGLVASFFGGPKSGIPMWRFTSAVFLMENGWHRFL
ncbi:hypothetical protein [Pedobacter suwonensis]|uniref:hypothetical protein n=1 Tax=Pedobacter suwonensis TaxID=332999 RepID=UPI001FD5857A|nr:hypothetical protein [Pedobacter suwonensis]